MKKLTSLTIVFRIFLDCPARLYANSMGRKNEFECLQTQKSIQNENRIKRCYREEDEYNKIGQPFIKNAELTFVQLFDYALNCLLYFYLQYLHIVKMLYSSVIKIS